MWRAGKIHNKMTYSIFNLFFSFLPSRYRQNYDLVRLVVKLQLTDISWKLVDVHGMGRVYDVAFVSHLSIVSHPAFLGNDKFTAKLIMQSKWRIFIH